jgi:hypothetical protein
MMANIRSATLAKKCLKYEGENVLPNDTIIARSTPTDDHPEGEKDYNYVEMTGFYQTYRSALQQCASRIAARMHNADVRVSENIIHDILLRCEENSLQCMPYMGLSIRGQIEESFPIVVVKSHSVWFLRGFLDTVLAVKPGEDFFAKAIREMRHKHTPTQTLVLGQTLRTDPKRFYPYLLRTIDTGPNPDKTITATDFSRLNAGYIKLRDFNIEPESLEVIINDDLEMVKWFDYMVSLGRSQAEAHASPAEPSYLRHLPANEWVCPFRFPEEYVYETLVMENGVEEQHVVNDDDGKPLMQTRVCGKAFGDCEHLTHDYPQCYIDCELKQSQAKAREMKKAFDLVRIGTPPMKRRKLENEAVEKAVPVVTKKPVTTTTTSEITSLEKLLSSIPVDKRAATQSAWLEQLSVMVKGT